MRLAELAERLGCRLEGDPEKKITGVAGLMEAGPGDLTFLANPRYRPAVNATRAAAIVVREDAGKVPLAALRSPDPYFAFARAIDLFHPPESFKPAIHPSSAVAASAVIGRGAHIGPYCFIDEDVRIGKNAVLHSFVAVYRGATIGDDFLAHSHTVVREGCRVGNRVVLQNGVVVGSDGFGFARTPEGRWHKMRQAGITVVEDDVEIQANTCVDRATIGRTHIGRGAKIDNLVQIGHACHIGEDTLLCAQVGLAGSTTLGNRVILAGQVGSSGHLKVGDGAVLTAQSGIPRDVAPGAVHSGSPAFENKQWLKSVAVYRRLPDLQHAVRQLQSEIGELRSQVSRAASRPRRGKSHKVKKTRTKR
ncbi:MAG TPA: UDP-3-O-(3-hydroxymyristoyl)glucosamine N-acyltransferase [Candidatus Dormibacteraeota bacterium]|nr:UDP-3-O-(3-hydroxymyristoyl)glucosamine N-acyltransferase [Candidatus Dormibacteraeota bacterium]